MCLSVEKAVRGKREWDPTSHIPHPTPPQQARCPMAEVTPGQSKGAELPRAHCAQLRGDISGSPYQIMHIIPEPWASSCS